MDSVLWQTWEHIVNSVIKQISYVQNTSFQLTVLVYVYVKFVQGLYVYNSITGAM